MESVGAVMFFFCRNYSNNSSSPLLIMLLNNIPLLRNKVLFDLFNAVLLRRLRLGENWSVEVKRGILTGADRHVPVFEALIERKGCKWAYCSPETG